MRGLYPIPRMKSASCGPVRMLGPRIGLDALVAAFSNSMIPSTVAVNRPVQEALDDGHLPPSTHQSRLSTPDGVMPFVDAQQAVRAHRLVSTLDADHLRFTESR